ncbi:hypothetical protein [Hyphococcus sp.]|jgi:hypothetical protein|uniref:hypothetical protein n=1 Tax=Hyphococcus sp. TaxID=2038636 RepID=UPI003D0B8EC7
MSKQVRIGIIAAGVMIALAAALKDNAVAFGIGVAILVALGGLSSGRRDCGKD